jgi:thymidylate synthase
VRIYKDFPEAQNEIRRDLGELGITVHPETMQDIYVKDMDEFTTKELPNYDYQVLDPDFTMVQGVHQDWVRQEWEDRLIGGLNPGRAWKKRPEVWEPFLHPETRHKEYRKFAYTYSDRMGGVHIDRIIDELKEHPNSRQLWMPVWDRIIDEDRRGGIKRVPCSLGYQFLYRQDELHLTYMMRSCDFATHYANDVALAAILLAYVSKKTGMKVGTFTHFIGSLHIYAKDVADVF